MAIEIVKLALTLIVSIFGIFLVSGFITGQFEHLNAIYIGKAFGRAGIFITSFIGTPVHEFGHFIMCIIFRHKIVEVKWFRPIASQTDGILGYVNHRYNPSSLYQNIGNFFIGMAPLFVGSLIIIILSRFLIPETFNAITHMKEISVKNILSAIFTANNLKSISFWIFVFLSVSISTHMELSSQDIKGSISGIVAIIIIIILFSIIIKIFGIGTINIFQGIKLYNYAFGIVFLIGILFSLLTLIVSFLVSVVRGL